MTVFVCEGFETFGDKLSSGADVETRIDTTDSGGDGSLSFDIVSGGHGGNVSIIDDFETTGFALEFPQLDAARAEWITFEFPDGTGRHADYKVATDGASPVMCAGFRFYNASVSPGLTSQIFSILTTATTAQSSLRVDAGGTDLTFVDSGSNTYTASSVLTQGEWHYIEIEWILTTSGSGGYAKVYVDGVEVIDTGAASISNFTFNTSYGFRIGCTSDTNQTGGDNFAFDDVYGMEIDGVTHSAPLGPVRVLLLSPTSDATPNDWTPSTGADNFALVDEQDWDTADYVDATATGNDDHYGLSTLAAADTVHGIQIDVVCVAVDGTPTLHIGTDDGVNTDEQNMGIIATGSNIQKRMFFGTDPAGGTWSVADVNGTEFTQRMTE